MSTALAAQHRLGRTSSDGTPWAFPKAPSLNIKPHDTPRHTALPLIQSQKTRMGSQCPGAAHAEQPFRVAAASLPESRILVLPASHPFQTALSPWPPDPLPVLRPFPSLSILCSSFPE